MEKNKVTYRNNEALEEVKKDKVPLSKVIKRMSAPIAAVAGAIMSNKVVVFIVGMAKDEVIGWLRDRAGYLEGMADFKYTEGAMHQALNILSEGLRVTSRGISFVFNAMIADPVVAALIVATVAAVGGMIFGTVASALINKFSKKGKVKVNGKTLTK